MDGIERIVLREIDALLQNINLPPLMECQVFVDGEILVFRSVLSHIAVDVMHRGSGPLPFADDAVIVFPAAHQQHRAYSEDGEGFGYVVCHIDYVFEGSLFRQRMVSSI